MDIRQGFCRTLSIRLSRLAAVTIVTALYVCAGFVQPVRAVNNTWVFNGDGNWNDAVKWSLGVPAEGAGITAVIDDGDTAVTVTLDTSHSVDALSLGSNDTLLIQSNNASSVSLTSNTSFTNAGTINLTGTDIQTTFLILPTTGDSTLTNTGTLNFQVGADTGSRIFQGDLFNSGTVNVNYNTTFNKGAGTYTNTGQLNVPSGKTLTIGGNGTLNHNAGGTFTLSGVLQNSGSTFNMNGGTMNFGATALVDNGNFNYLSGTIAGDVKLRNSTFTIGVGTNAETFQLDYSNTLASSVGAGHTINIQSGSGSSVSLTSNTSFTNAGTINLTGTDIQTTFLILPTTGDSTLTNTGTLNFQVGADTGSRIFQGDLVNSGTVNVTYNTTFNKGAGTYTNTGQLNVASSKTLTISGNGTLNQNAGGTFTLSGTLQNSGSTFNMNGGTMNFGASALVDNGNFNYLGGTIAGDVKLRNSTFTIGPGTNPETFQLDYSNTLASSVGAGQTINIQSGSASSVSLTSNTSFTNAGTINLTGTDIQTTFLILPTTGNDTLTNTGTLNFQVGAGTGSRIFQGNLVNSGTVNVNYNTTFNKGAGTYTNTGQLNVPGGETLTIGGNGTLNQNAGGTFTLSGVLQNSGSTFNMNGGTMNFDASALVDNGNFNYLGGTIAGNVKLRNSTFTIGVGTNAETFQLDYSNTLASSVGAGHTINIQSNNASSVSLTSNTSFTNAGTINLTGTDIQTTFLILPTTGNDTLTNTGTLNFQVGAGTGSRIFQGNLVNSGTVNVNYGTTFNKGAGTYTNSGVFKISNGSVLDITNAGTLTNQTGTTLTGGTFDLSGNLRYAGAFVQTNQAEIILRGGTIESSAGADALRQMSVNGTSAKLRVLNGVTYGAEVPIFTNEGLLELGGGIFNGAVFNYGVPFVNGQRDFINSSTGQIIGRGTFQSGSTLGTFTNSGLISPGTSPGILQIDDKYTQTATGTLSIGIGNNNAQYDVLKVLNTAVLGGSLALALDASFTPSINDVFTVFDAFSFTGVFANIANGQRLATTGGQGSFVVTYNAGIGDVILSSFAINGDYNANGIVDAGDYILWRKTLASYGGAGGYNTWRSNFGRTNLPGAGSGAGSVTSQTAVPEPGTALLALMALAAAAFQSGQRRRSSHR